MKHALVLLVLTGCPDLGDTDRAVSFGNAAASTRDYVHRVEGSDPSSFEAELHGRYSVPPERAILRVDLQLARASSDEATSASIAARRTLVRLFDEAEHCEARVMDIGPTTRVAWDDWSASSLLRVDIDLRGAEDVESRSARIEACTAVFFREEPELENVHVRIGTPLPTIDDPSSHREALLERELARLRSVAAQPNAPAQFSADALDCTSTGEVHIVDRTLAGIALAVDLDCGRGRATPEAPVAPFTPE
jgi:hypothetical protein